MQKSRQKSLSIRAATILAGGVSLLALAYGQSATAQQSAQADQPSASSSGGLEEIVVTARRKEEKAQSVPIAISNVSAQQLNEQKILLPEDILKDVTGIAVAGSGSRNTLGSGGFSNLYQWVRGVPGVIPYWADVATVASGGLTFDIASFQLLKGPQGTLFGQATNGGAMVYQPKLPTNAFEGYVSAEVGDYGHTRLEGIINIPIVDDVLLVRIGGRTNHTDGFVYDIAHKTWNGSEGSQNMRLAVTLRPIDSIQNDFIGNHYTYNDAAGLAVPWILYPQYYGPNNPYLGLAPGAPANTEAAILTYKTLGWYAVPGNTAVPYGGLETGFWDNLVNTTRWDINDNLTLKNIAGYTQGGAGTSYTAAVLTTTYSPASFGNQIISHPVGVGVEASDELQLLGKALDDKLTFTTGAIDAYLQNSTAPHAVTISCSRVTLGGIQNGGVASGCGGSLSYFSERTYGVYAQGNYDLSDFVDGLSFTAGYRYTWDTQYGVSYSFVGVPQTQTITGSNAGFGQKEDSKAGSYTLNLDWQVDPKTLLYVSNAKGFSKGGLNLTATLPAGPGRTFAPESLNNIEAGIKADWDLPWDMKARTNVSVFYGMYDNIQVSARLPTLDAFGLPTAIVVTQNAATAHIEGTDFAFTLLPTDDISVSVAGTWTIGAYDSYPYCAAFVGASTTCQPGQQYDVKEAPLLFDPKWTWNVRVGYTLPLDESLGKAVLAATLTHVGGFYVSVGPYPPTVGWPGPPVGDYNHQTSEVSMSLTWSDFLGRQGLDAQATVTNLTNGLWRFGNCGCTAYPLGLATVNVAPPRMYAAGLKYSFGP